MNEDTGFSGLLQRIRTRAQLYRSALRKVKTDPLTARHWHDATDPHQAARIEAAAAKRARKAKALHVNAVQSRMNNDAHNRFAAHDSYRLDTLHVTK